MVSLSPPRVSPRVRSPRFRRTAALALAATAIFAGAGLTRADAATGKKEAAPPAEPAPVPQKQPPIGTAAYSWLLTINGTIIVAPDFPGAKTYGFVVFPSLSLRRTDSADVWQAPDDGVSIALFGNSQWALGVTGRYQIGRYRSDDKVGLYGVQDAKWAVEPGIFGQFWAVPDTIRLRAEVRYGLNGYNGFVGALAADYVARVGKFTLSLGPRVQISGSEYMDTYFGVTPQDAAFNGHLSAYAPDPGIKSVGLTASATYKWNEQWATTVRGGYDRLVGSAADSPIVKQLGSPNQFTLGATASYTFDIRQLGLNR